MTTKAAQLREAIARSRTGEGRWRCPKPLRREAARYAEAQIQRGRRLHEVARELGISRSGLARWLRRGEGRIRPVRVIESPLPPPSPAPAESSGAEGLVLVTPDGYRLEGLDSAAAVEILRGLQC